MEEHGVIIRRVINAGGIPQKNDVLNQVYANVLGRPVLVPAGNAVSLGSAIFAFLAAGVFSSLEEAQDKICPPYKIFQPALSAKAVYDTLYAFYNKIYFAFGRPQNAEFGNVLPGLIHLSESARLDAARE
jgi:L-ribulokinase